MAALMKKEFVGKHFQPDFMILVGQFVYFLFFYFLVFSGEINFCDPSVFSA